MAGGKRGRKREGEGVGWRVIYPDDKTQIADDDDDDNDNDDDDR